MKRGTIALDRVATFIVAVLLIAAGVLLGLWWYGGSTSLLPPTLDTAQETRVMGLPWWPWATAIVGVVLVVLGLRWLTAHLPDRGVGRVVLPGSGQGGRLHSDAGTVASAAAEELESTRGVRSARATMLRERGQTVARFRVTVEPETDLAQLGRAADRVSAELAQVLGRDDLRCSVLVRVASRGRDLSRVR